MIKTSEIIKIANNLVKEYNTRSPRAIAELLGITVIPIKWHRQKGAYTVILGSSFIFLNDALDENTENIVLLHEIGHHILHGDEISKNQNKWCFTEFNLFDIKNSRTEYEANIFAAQIALDDAEFLSYCEKGYDIQMIACAMKSDINLVALKCDSLIAQGYRLHPQEHDNTYLGK